MRKKDKKNLEKKSKKNEEPKKWHFPFWGRLRFEKNRTTLVIDEEPVINKKTKKEEPGFVHREATHTNKKGFEEIKPNPDKDDKNSMFLKPARKIPQKMIKPHNKNLDMPKHLEERYSKNNKKKS